MEVAVFRYPKLSKPGTRKKFLEIGRRCYLTGLSCLLALCSTNSVADDDTLTLGEFTTHIVDTFTLIGDLTLTTAIAMKRTAEDGAVIIDYYVNYHRDGFDEFTDGNGSGCLETCKEFRENLVILVGIQQEIMNLIPPAFGAYARIQGLEPPPNLPPVNLSPLLEVLGEAPAFILYPLYDALKQFTGDANEGLIYLIQLSDNAIDGLESVIEVGSGNSVRSKVYLADTLEAGRGASLTASSVHGSACQVMTDEFSTTKLLYAVPLIRFFSASMNLIGDSIILRGRNMVQKLDTGISLVGKTTTYFNVNGAGTFGEILRFLGKATESLANGIFSTVNSCRLRLNNQLMFCMLTEKNLHETKKDNTHRDCLKKVSAGDENFGFSENWLEKMREVQQ